MKILLEDDSVVVIDKPVGISTIPERLDPQGACIRKSVEEAIGQKLLVVHRLDKEVSGVLVFAKTAEAHRFLSMEFEHHRVAKTYLALLWGYLEQSVGLIDKPIRQFGSGRMGIDDDQGKASQTEYQVIERWKDLTLVEAMPKTGRRHQLRVHFYSAGHPIVGDRRYHLPRWTEQLPRLMLHSHKLRIRHPSGKFLEVESPPPVAFEDILTSFRQQAYHGVGIKAVAGLT
ncbi:MAG: RNA pseudouridine synthase [Spirochaetales bacterium]